MNAGRLLVLALAVGSAAHADELARVGEPAPTFRLPVLNAAVVGETALGLDAFVGRAAGDRATRVLLVSFMASFCAPCRRELPALQALFERHRGRGLRVLAVNLDTEVEGQQRVLALLEQHRVTFPVLKDRFTLVARRWLGPQSPLPSLFVLRPDGTVKAVHRGYSEDGVALLGREVEAALAGAP